VKNSDIRHFWPKQPVTMRQI